MQRDRICWPRSFEIIATVRRVMVRACFKGALYQRGQSVEIDVCLVVDEVRWKIGSGLYFGQGIYMFTIEWIRGCSDVKGVVVHSRDKRHSSRSAPLQPYANLIR